MPKPTRLKVVSRVFFTILVVGAPAHALYQRQPKNLKNVVQAEAVEGEFLVKFSPGAAAQSFVQLKNKYGMSVVETVHLKSNLHRIKVTDTKKLQSHFASINRLSSPVARKRIRQQIVDELSTLEGVDYVEPNFIYRMATVPNDPSFEKLWAMSNSGQNDSMGVPGKVGSDIAATQAWAIETGSKNVVVAVIDTGIDYTHPDLKDNIWSEPEHPEIHGFNAITGVEDPMDDNSHGTHCSGTIGAAGNNGLGVVGVNWHVSLMGSKFLNSTGSGNLADAIKAIDWATEHGAQIMNNSWSGGEYSQAMLEAIERARDKGILFVAAAGNASSDNDAVPNYPASYPVDNIVVVASSNNTDGMSFFSNYGQKSVHLLAPGENILSSVIKGAYDVYSGTSMAAPHVSGASALLLTREPHLTPTEIRSRLMSSADKLKAYRSKLVSGGRLNLFNLLLNVIPPGPPVIPESAWSAPVPHVLSSPHPYLNNGLQTFEIDQPGATYIRVHFSKFETEGAYDVVSLMNASGEVVDTLSGTLSGPLWTLEVDGPKFILQLKSDGSVNKYGFDIDSYSWTSFVQ